MIIKIDQAETLKWSSEQIQHTLDTVNVFTGKYSDNLKAHFVRTRAGVALFVNKRLTSAEKAKAIKMVCNNIKKCGISEMGMIHGNWIYSCGGTCCKSNITNKERSV